MSSPSVVLLSVPGLRPGDIADPEVTPHLSALAGSGGSIPLTPTFPCVTSPVQASMLTGKRPGEHGVIANGFYWRDREQVEFWVGRHDVIEAESFLTRLKRQRPGVTQAVWHAQNIKGAAADHIVTPSPIHEADGTMKLWCYSKPDGLYQEMLAELGHFPLQHYWGPLANIESTRWIVEAALWLAKRQTIGFHYIYLPHLDYAAQKFGPDAPQSLAALGEFDAVVGELIERYRTLPGGGDVRWMVAGEYALTPVTFAVHPNRLLREAGLLAVRAEDDGEYLDLAGSDAFAMVDHQCAHVFTKPGQAQRAAEVFRGVAGIDQVLEGEARAAMGMDHPRCGEVVLMSDADCWFTYYWWDDDGAAPPFARTVDIHAKPGYDPVELFIKMPERQIPLDAGLVKGSHGAPAVSQAQQTVLICSDTALLEGRSADVSDADIFDLLYSAYDLH